MWLWSVKARLIRLIYLLGYASLPCLSRVYCICYFF